MVTENYLSLISDLVRINKLTGAPELVRPVEMLLNGQLKNINIAVLGQFKTGKSSLINSLLDSDILPVGVVPLTAIVTQVMYGDEASIHLKFKDGKEINASLEDLPTYVTEKHNPANVRNVEQAVVYHPALKDFPQVSLVDTPGLGSFYKHNSDATIQWLPFTGVAMVVISAERPLSEEDITLLKGIASYCPDVVIVVTKTDLFDEKQLDEIKQYIKESARKALKRDIPLFDYSIIRQPDYFRKAILDEIILPLHETIELKRHEIMLFKLKSAIDQSIVYADLALQAALKRVAEKTRITKTLHDMEHNRHHHEREMMLTTSAFKGEFRERLENIILQHLPDVETHLINAFEADFNGFSGTLFSVSKQFEQWLIEKIGNELLKIDESNYDHVNQFVLEYMEYYRYTAVQFRQQLEEKLTETFGIHLSEAFWQCDFMGVEKADVSIYRVFDSQLDTLLFFLPMKGFRKLFYTHFKKQIPLEAEKNLHRYISNVTVKVFQSIDAMHFQAIDYINSEMKVIVAILNKETGNADELLHALDELKMMQQSVVNKMDK
jgi:GTP-binding protein EngB required for normal cell division